MSFRWNISRDVSDRSFFTQGNELIATSIGVTGNRSALSCRLNMDQKDVKYCRTEEQILQSLSLVEQKLKRWAFRNIQKITHYHREVSNSVFVPAALEQGNYSVLEQFLGKLRNNRVDSYIKLNLQESYGYFHKAATLFKPTIRIFKETMHFAFNRLRANMEEKQRRDNNRILVDIQRYSSIQNQNSLEEELSPSRRGEVNVSYVLVKVNPGKLGKSSQSSGDRKSVRVKKTSINGKIRSYIDLQDLIEDDRIREYQFKHANNLTYPKLNSERTIKNKKI